MRYSTLPPGHIPRVNGVGDWISDLIHEAGEVGREYVGGGNGDQPHTAVPPAGGSTPPAGGSAGAGGGTAQKSNTWLWLGVAGLGVVLVMMMAKKR